MASLGLVSPWVATDGCHPIFFLKKSDNLFLVIVSESDVVPHDSHLPRRLSSVLSKFGHKKFLGRVSPPLEGVTRGGLPPPLSPSDATGRAVDPSPYLTWQRSRQKRNGTLVHDTASDRHSKSSSRVSSVLCRCSFQTATRPCLSRIVDSRQTGRLLAARRRNRERFSRSCVASSRLDPDSRASTAPEHSVRPTHLQKTK